MFRRNYIKIILFALLFVLPLIYGSNYQHIQDPDPNAPKVGANWGFLENFKASQYYLSPEASPGVNDQVFFTFKMDKDGNYSISITSAPAYFASTSDKEADVSFDQPSGSTLWYFAYSELRDVFNGQCSLKMRTSNDFGKTWAINTIATWNSVGENMMDIMYYLKRTAIAVRPETGVISALTWVNGTNLTFIDSMSNGTSWGIPRTILNIADLGFTKSILESPHFDTAILPNGTIVVVCDANNTAKPQLTPVIYLQSNDNGTTWSTSPQNVSCVNTPKAYNPRIQVDASGGKYWLMWRAVNGVVYNNRWAEFNSTQDLNNATVIVKNVTTPMRGNYDFIRDITGGFHLFEIRFVSPISNNTQWTCPDFASNWTSKQILPGIEDLHQNSLYNDLWDFSMAYDGKTEHYFYAGEAESGGTSTTGLFHYILESNRTFWEKKGNFSAGNLAQESWNGKAQGTYAINVSRVRVDFVAQNNSYTPDQLESSLYINIDNNQPDFNEFDQGKFYFNPISPEPLYNTLNWSIRPSESISYKLEVFQDQSQLNPPRSITSNNFDEDISSSKIFISTTGQLFVVYTTLKEGVKEINLIRSSNGGVTWTTPTTILTASGYIGEIACAAYADTVVLIITYNSGVTTTTQLYRSFDQGVSFESPVSLLEPLFPEYNRDVESCAFSKNGTLFTGYLIPAIEDSPPYSRGEFHILRSDNFGLTWSESQMWFLDPGYNQTRDVQPAFVSDPINDLIHVCLPQTNNTYGVSYAEEYKVANFSFSTLNMSDGTWGPIRSTGAFPIGIYFMQPQFVIWQENLTSPLTAKLFFMLNFYSTPVVDLVYNEIDSVDLGSSWNLPHPSMLDNISVVAAEIGTWYYLDSMSDGNDEELVLTCDTRKVRTQEGSLPPAQLSEVVYDGKRDDGSYLPPKNYTYQLTLVDNAGNRQNRTGWFFIDHFAPNMTIGPNLNWSILPTPRFDVNVSINVSDDIGFGVWLNYQKDKENCQIPMIRVGDEDNNTFYAIIPGDSYTMSVKYYITAIDAAGNMATRNNGGVNYEYHIPSFSWTAIGLFNSTVDYFSGQDYEFNLTITKDAPFVDRIIFRYSFDGATWQDQVLRAAGPLYSGLLQNLPGDLKTLRYQLIAIDVFSNEVVLVSTQQISFYPEIPTVAFSDVELILVLTASLMIGIAISLGYLKLKHVSHSVISRQMLAPTESVPPQVDQYLGEREVRGRKNKKSTKESTASQPRSPFTYVFLVAFAGSILVEVAGLQIASLSAVWAVIALVASLLLGVFGFMILSSRDIAENIYSEKIRFSNVLLEVFQVGVLLWIIINILQVGYMIPWFRYYLIDSTYDFFGILIPKLYVSIIGVFFTSLVVVLISTYLELRSTVRNIQRQKKDSGLAGIALLYIKDEHSNRLITNMGIKTVIFLITVLVTIVTTTDLLTFENVIALAEVLGPFAIGSLLVLMIQPALTKRREQATKNFQLPFIEAEKICTKCGTKIFLSSRYCKVCGAQQVFDQVVGQYNTRCVKCGGLISKDSAFCTSCGTKSQLSF